MWNVDNGSVVPPQFASVAFEFILYLMIKVIQSANGGEWFMNWNFKCGPLFIL